MYYSTVEIRPSLRSPRWDVSYSDIPDDLEAGQSSMSGFGFYHYPREVGKRAAFDALKAYMIQRHKDEIQRLEKSLKKLEMLESGL